MTDFRTWPDNAFAEDCTALKVGDVVRKEQIAFMKRGDIRFVSHETFWSRMGFSVPDFEIAYIPKPQEQTNVTLN